MSNHQAEGAEPLPTASADAELIATCEQHIVNLRAFNTSASTAEPEDDPLWAAYIHTYAAVGAGSPKTVAGMIAIAHAAKAEALQLDGTERPENGTAAKWAWNLVNNLLRLKEEGAI